MERIRSLRLTSGRLRELLARYSGGDVEGAVGSVLAKAPRWIRAAVEMAMRRTDEEIKYHRQPANRLGAARDERLERYLRADRLNVLLLAAVLQLQASRAATAVDAVGWHVAGSERTIDRLHAWRSAESPTNIISRQPPVNGLNAPSLQIRGRSIRGDAISRARRGRWANA